MPPVDPQFLDLYDKHRVGGQLQYYEDRIDEYTKAGNQAALLRFFLLAGAAVLGGFGALVPEIRVLFAVLAATLTALAATVTAWSELVGFGLNKDLYGNARSALRMLRPDRPREGADRAAVGAYVDQVEEIMLSEVGAWSKQWRKRAEEADADDDGA